MMFSPSGERMYESLRYSAKKCKADWCGGIDSWSKWKDNGWSVHPVIVEVEPITKGNILKKLVKNKK